MTDLNDSLEGMFGPQTQDDHDGGQDYEILARRSHARPLPAELAKAAEVGGQYFETCPKCRGTGRFHAYGPCYACQGKGRRTFKTSPEQRARKGEQSRASKARKQQEMLDSFAAAHPAVWAWMQEGAADRQNPTLTFAASLLEKLIQWGDLTERQLAAAEGAIAKREAAKQDRAARAQAAPAVDISRIERAMVAAQAKGIHSPRLRLGDVTFSLAGPNSSNAGAIYAKAADTYLGKIMGGRFHASRECTPDQQRVVLAAAADPEAAAVAYGLRTGSCSCCGRELTDPKSIDRGIGPVCAANYGW